ncbi:MAG: uracil-DNA glycosylase [Candidatus Eremiobacteraeota bacterium]|nr:uracil-DNA glycosylase [Candidatus Eremiobacteraeota bacterium]
MAEVLDRIAERIVGCTRCPDLRAYCAQVAREKRRAYASESYWGKPVPAFGDPRARLMLVGLAPGAHGSNRTGRAFTGDASGDFLYPALHRAGFASAARATARNDGLILYDCFITAAGRCAPPNNKPTPQQLRNCFPYLLEEFDALPNLQVVVGLGKIGFDAVIRMLKERAFDFETRRIAFGHGAHYVAESRARRITAIATYHPSRQNTNTGKLTVPMFDTIFTEARTLLR